jgi:16S rRNA (cytidine1402-2'-O)-methyltransferase
MKLGRLYLIPVPLGEGAPLDAIPEATRRCALGLREFVAETPKSARRFLKQIGITLAEVQLYSLNEHTRPSELPLLLAPVLEGKDMGLMSDGGCPAIADPGAALVALAHTHGVQVLPLVGPCAIALALMGSGMNGQRFCFRGYLPVERASREAKIREMEAQSRSHDETQILIETPYRNQQLFASLLETCMPATRLCVAADLTLRSEYIQTASVAEWRASSAPTFERRPAVFLLYSGESR